MSNGIINWHEEKADGQFIAKSAKPQKLDWWVQQVILGRQLTMAPANVRTKLINFNNQRFIKGNINGEFNQMFIGVYQNDFSLYLDVSTKVNDLIKKAIDETWKMTESEDFRKSQNSADLKIALSVLFIQMVLARSVTTDMIAALKLGKGLLFLLAGGMPLSHYQYYKDF